MVGGSTPCSLTQPNHILTCHGKLFLVGRFRPNPTALDLGPTLYEKSFMVARLTTLSPAVTYILIQCKDGVAGVMACHPIFLIFSLFLFLNKKHHLLKDYYFDQRIQVNDLIIYRGIGLGLAIIWWPKNFQIVFTLNFHIINSTLELWLPLNFEYDLNFMNRSHHCNKEDKIFKLNLVWYQYEHFNFWAFKSPLFPLHVSGTT